MIAPEAVADRPNRRVGRLTAALAVVVMTVSGCNYEGINSFGLPGTEGTGPGSYKVRIELPNALNVVPNNPVRIGDVNVGTITNIALKGWHAEVTVSLNPEVTLPTNTVAKVGQTSLLGAKHIELAPPEGGGAAEAPRLRAGDVIPLRRSGAYPETEEVLASVSALLNGGGLGHLKTIVAEMNTALSGREGRTRDLLRQVNRFVTGLDEQKNDIVHAMNGLNRLASRMGNKNEVVARALRDFPKALRVLNREKKNLVDTLEAMGKFGEGFNAFIDRAGEDLVTNVSALRPTLKGIADAGDSLQGSLKLLGTVFFPLDGIGEMVRSDYVNLWATVDLRLETLDTNLLTGTPLEGSLAGPAGLLGQLSGRAGRSDNPVVPGEQPDTQQGGTP